jgi:hypothetical protein
MTEDIQVDKDRFDAVLKRLASMRPKSLKEAVAAPKTNKDGSPRKKRVSS